MAPEPTPKSINDGEQKIDSTSPYYLHPSDHTGMLITPVKLNGENYEEWSRSMRNAFRARRKLSFLDGKITQPDLNASNIEDWWSVNSMLLGWIFTSIEPSLRSTVTYYKTVKELWDDLKERFSIGNGSRVLQLRADLAKCRQDGHSVADYYGRLKVIWEEINTYVKPPMCACGKCSCSLFSQWELQREEERVHQLLMGLHDAAYGTIRSNIIAQDPLPNLSRVYALVIQEERHQTITRTRDMRSDVNSFAVQAQKAGKGYEVGTFSGFGDKPTCTHCGKRGHMAESCFKLVGFPNWYRGKGGISGRGQGSRRGANDQIVANTARTNPTDGGKSGRQVLSSQDRIALANTLSDTQWAAIVSMVNMSNNDG